MHIEGILIHGETDVMFDGIDINAPEATVQIENVRMTGVWGSDGTEHADAIQTWGGVKDLRVDHLLADGDYQGHDCARHRSDGIGGNRERGLDGRSDATGAGIGHHRRRTHDLDDDRGSNV